MSKLPVKIIYRSKKISIPLLAAMEATDAWERAGLDVERLEYITPSSKSDPMLIAGEVDFIFGSHVSPYIRKAEGAPMVYLGQSVNWCADSLVTREPVADLASLRGAVLAENKVKADNHPWGNHKLYLQRGGVDLTQVDFLGVDSHGGSQKSAYELVADGLADAAIVMPPQDMLAQELGLVSQKLPFLPMVQSTTLTTMWETREQRPELCRRVIRAVREGIRYFKYEREAMLKVMEDKVGPALGIDSQDVLAGLYDVNAMLLEESLYPTTDAISNAYKLAVFRDPSVQKKVNPMELWDIDLLRQVDEAERQLAVTGS